MKNLRKIQKVCNTLKTMLHKEPLNVTTVNVFTHFISTALQKSKDNMESNLIQNFCYHSVKDTYDAAQSDPI